MLLKCDCCGNYFERKYVHPDRADWHKFCSRRCLTDHTKTRRLVRPHVRDNKSNTIIEKSCIRKAWIIFNRLNSDYYETLAERRRKYAKWSNRFNDINPDDREKYLEEAKQMLRSDQYV